MRHKIELMESGSGCDWFPYCSKDQSAMRQQTNDLCDSSKSHDYARWCWSMPFALKDQAGQTRSPPGFMAVKSRY